MDAKLRQKLKAWDREERYQATIAMVRATEQGDLPRTRNLLKRFPLLDYWIPYERDSWAEVAAAAGQLKLLKFWLERDQSLGKKPVPLEELFFCAMGDEDIKARKGNPVQVAKYLLGRGATIEGNPKSNYSPLHRAAFMNRPDLIELLIQRGANLARPYVTGESALQIARRNLVSKACARLLEKAGAPLKLPKKPERPKPVHTVDLRESAAKLKTTIEKAVRRFARQHPKETVSAIALASTPHEGYVMVAFDTGKFEGNPWDCNYDEFAYASFPDWHRAHEGDAMRLIDLNGRIAQKEPDAFYPRFKSMIVTTLRDLEQQGIFDALSATKDCKLGIEMTAAGEGKFWKLVSPKGNRA